MKKLVLPILFLCSSCYVSDVLPPDQTFWQYKQPSSYSFDEPLLLRLDSLIKSENFGSINSLIMIKNNELIFENYYNNSFRSRQRPIDVATFGYAVAFLDFFINDGLIGNLDEPIYTFLPEYEAIFEATPDKKLITFRHLLLQESGLSWSQLDASTNSSSDIFIMKTSPDWASHILNQELASQPGTRSAINTASGVIFFKIFQNLLGDIELESYLDEHYFAPMNITNYTWNKDPLGTLDGATGLSLSSFDHAKFATLMVNSGRTPDKIRIFSDTWVFEMMLPQAPFTDNFDLGYGWRLLKSSTTSAFNLDGYIFLTGEIGQCLYINPSQNLVVAVGAENYFQNILFNSSFYLFFNVLNSKPKN